MRTAVAATTNGALVAPFVRVPGARLRHNRGMRRIAWMFLMTMAMLAGCDSGTPVGAGVQGPASSSALEFRGERPCADCDGIAAWLRLEHEGRQQHYRLLEHYRGERGERQFEDEGDWLAEGDLLRLRSRAGGERVYARLADGTLQARDAHGRPLPAAIDDVMMPVTFDTAH